MEDTTNQRKVIITFLAVVIIAVIVVGAVAASPKKSSGSNSGALASAATSDSGSTSNTSNVSSNTSFKDGSYTGTGSYESPGGNESITVHVTLQNGVITATSADSGAQDSTASEYQGMFIDGYKSLVVGKNIASVKLSRVSGSSLTSQGFNEAISSIENQAKV